ncbi:hypothetical protein [Pelagicoccus sp. SDUM812003]|uniref:hypothetical protein n=1 Tax=Pelagicoccus sp. SDUM812003 TaxID=3041267 RepID=UPI00281073B2|nr:hypothetical protein [Pelagicoccus sp. SDUM812003]MDQ8205378.1 hypothetical protein [Pelagicoccus sp. SDUM812003]
MDSQKAKLILSNYTLGPEPNEDETFDAARRFAAQDPELASWWERQKQEDRAIQEKLDASAPPADLRAALHATIEYQQSAKRRRFVLLRNWISLAAAFVLGIGIYYQYGIDRSDDYSGTLTQMAYQYSVDGPRLKYFDKDTQNLRQWLTSNGFDLPEQLPPKLLDQEGIGCRPLDWSTQRVALMCFNAETVYHLFIGQEGDFPEFDASSEIEYASYDDGWTISKWKDQEHLFVLTAKAPPEQMSNYLASK